jgi:hypothetical protein
MTEKMILPGKGYIVDGVTFVKGTCDICAFYLDGLCRRRAPVVFMVPRPDGYGGLLHDFDTHFPVVGLKEFCGDWELDEAKNAEIAAQDATIQELGIRCTELKAERDALKAEVDWLREALEVAAGRLARRGHSVGAQEAAAALTPKEN